MIILAQPEKMIQIKIRSRKKTLKIEKFLFVDIMLEAYVVMDYLVEQPRMESITAPSGIQSHARSGCKMD